MNVQPSESYKNRSQIARVISEGWVRDQLYCPFCGGDQLMKFENNRPAADFFCPRCKEQYELKSKHGKESSLIPDGAYLTMVQRIESETNPNFLLMFYSGNEPRINNLLTIPKYFLTTDIIQKRKPLSATARRVGWVGCNLHLDRLPVESKTYIVQNGIEIAKTDVLASIKNAGFVAAISQSQRGWLFDTMMCIQRIPQNEFSIADVYAFADELALKYPQNHFIREKLRQQLQLLRDAKYIDFMGDGRYRKKHTGMPGFL